MASLSKHLALGAAATLAMGWMTHASAHNDPQPLTLPIPTYPSEAVMAGLSGSCVVHFDIDQSGTVIAPRAECTDRVFCEEVVRTISEVSFDPKVEDGKIVPQYGVTYPFAFSISGQVSESGNDSLKDCEPEEGAVS